MARLRTLLYCLLPTAYCQDFDRIVIDANFPGAYQVEVADVNGDSKPDVIAVRGSTRAWYENPTWKKRVVTGSKETPGIISSATADIDGDGKAVIDRGIAAQDVRGGDLNGDGTPDVVAVGGSTHNVVWYRFGRTNVK